MVSNLFGATSNAFTIAPSVVLYDKLAVLRVFDHLSIPIIFREGNGHEKALFRCELVIVCKGPLQSAHHDGYITFIVKHQDFGVHVDTSCDKHYHRKACAHIAEVLFTPIFVQLPAWLLAELINLLKFAAQI